MLDIQFLTKNAVSQWLAKNGITEKFIMSVCVQLVMFLGMSRAYTILLKNVRLIQISEVHICHLKTIGGNRHYWGYDMWSSKNYFVFIFESFNL